MEEIKKKHAGGRPKGSKASHTLEAETYRKILIEEIVKRARPLALALLEKGLAGDVPALKEINERALGKVKDQIEVDHTIKTLIIDF